MTQQIWRLALLLGTALAALSLAQPALAYTELKVTGTVGAHRLLDTQLAPGGLCSYNYSSANGAYKLKHISVGPPRMKAVPGMGTEKVAWQFTIQRRIVGLGGPGPWANRYTSQRFVSSTDSTHNAPFHLYEGVKVVVPYAAGGDASADYRAIAKLIWYKADGTTVLGTATEKVDWYYGDEGDATFFPGGHCPDYN